MTDPTPDLPCGRDPQVLLTQVADGRGSRRDVHQRSCPYCGATLDELEALWTPVRRVAEHRPRAPEGLLDEVMRSLRVGADTVAGRLDDPRGQTRIAGRVVVVLARRLAAGVPGVRAALSRLVGDGPGGTDGTGGTGRPPAVEITLAATYGEDLAALGDRIRVTVARGLRELAGVEPSAVRVVVDDVLDP